jgi:hypothetical protein
MSDLISVTVPITDVEGWNAMVDRFYASEPIPLAVILTDAERALLAQCAGHLQRIPV